MAGRKSLAITERQYQILQVLWTYGPLTVRELRARLARGSRQPYTTVLGMIQTMEKAGLVLHAKEGAAHRYAAAVSSQEGTGRLLRDFVCRFFNGSAEALVLGLVGARSLTPDDLKEIEEKLNQAAEADSRPLPKPPKRRRTKK